MTALPICLPNFVKRGESGVYEWLTIGIFAASNVIIGAIFIGTVWLLVRGSCFPFAKRGVGFGVFSAPARHNCLKNFLCYITCSVQSAAMVASALGKSKAIPVIVLKNQFVMLSVF